ncbi:PREDICTED: ras-related protein RABG2-like [Dinoponera quadriceps]|uniref:Ras-related protein RABG2-like n=1 Tax=Dinoponera quadriceps TaxID=609295 RepID=A0A6P3XQ78_DINQU|nr:PREDICTED: ras-related protein RABG2-like [Dinoponera quadriceps]
MSSASTDLSSCNERVQIKLYELNVFDTVAVKEFGEVSQEYKDVDICLLMYAANDLSSFKNVMYWISKFKKEANNKNADTFTFVVVGNKQVVPDYARLISRKEANDWCWNNNHWHSEISTKEKPTIN